MRLFLLTMTVGATVFGSTYNFPILKQTLGGLDSEDGVVIAKSCAVYDSSSKINLKEVLKLAIAAEKEPLEEFVHIRQQIPSEEIIVNVPTKKALGPAVTGIGPRKILLLEDSSSGKRRKGPASDALFELVEKICQDL